MYRTAFRALAIVLLLTAVNSCTIYRETQPARTATEQLLFSTAAERVCDALAIQIPEGSKVYVDDSYVDGADSQYLIATLRDRILRHGGRLMISRYDADLVFEPRVGALSVDRKKTLVGLPSFSIPIPLAGNIQIPELAFFKKDRQQGVVKLALTSFDAATGKLHQSIKPVYGFSQRTDWVVLLFFGWQNNDLVPDPENGPWVGKSSFE